MKLCNCLDCDSVLECHCLIPIALLWLHNISYCLIMFSSLLDFVFSFWLELSGKSVSCTSFFYNIYLDFQFTDKASYLSQISGKYCSFLLQIDFYCLKNICPVLWFYLFCISVHFVSICLEFVFIIVKIFFNF